MKQRKSEINWKLVVRVACLMLLDVMLLYLACLLALLSRFDLSIHTLMRDSGFLPALHAAFPWMAIGMIALFIPLKLYSSLWDGGAAAHSVCLLPVCRRDAAADPVRRARPAAQLPGSGRAVSGGAAQRITLFLSSHPHDPAPLRQREAQEAHDAHRCRQCRHARAAGIPNERKTSENSQNNVVCVIDDDRDKLGKYIRNVKIAGTRDDIVALAQSRRIEEIVLAIPTAAVRERRNILQLCQKTGCRLKILPGIYQLANGEVNIQKIRNVDVQDLLGRDCVKVDLSQIAGYLSGKTILVTGGGGSIGSELCRQIARHTPKRLVLLDIYENNAYAIEQELHRTHPELDLAVCIGSVRDEMRVSSLFAQYRPDIVFHAAAHKHVPLMEGSPNEAIKNNVFGTLHVAQAADRYGTETFVLISTDKAVNPTNVMGASKRVCEMIVQTMAERSKTKFVAVRFGNVLGSNGSVIPLFRRQIEEGGPVTVTHPDIIRYFMTIPEAVSLVLQAGAYAGRGEIFVLDMGEPVRIDDLARNLIRLSGFEPDVDIEVRYTGLRPGEKLYEEMLMQEEGLRSTPNHLIHIGRPLDIDVPAFERQLTALAAACRENSPAIRTLLAQVVPTYHPEAGGRPAANVS